MDCVSRPGRLFLSGRIRLCTSVDSAGMGSHHRLKHLTVLAFIPVPSFQLVRKKLYLTRVLKGDPSRLNVRFQFLDCQYI